MSVAIRGGAIPLACALLAGAPGSAADRAPGGLSTAAERAPAPTSGLGDPGTVILYEFSGAIDLGSVATSVHCTNLGSTAAIDLRLVLFEQTGAPDCNATVATLQPSRTATLSSRATTVFSEDAVCVVAGGSVRGGGRIVADESGSLDLVCTAQLLDGESATPLFVERLDMHTATGLPVSELLIFADGFEIGATANWDATTP
jgi:hypothetical protein